MGIGDLGFMCERVSLPLCELVKGPDPNSTVQDVLKFGALPKCYPRSVDLANTVIFSVGNSFMHIGALVVLCLILYSVKTKMTAVGRVCMLHLFCIYTLLTILSLVIDAGVTPPGSASFPYLVSVQNGLTSATCASLALNAFWGFDFFSDDSRLTILMHRLVCLAAFALTFVISLLTAQSWGGSAFSPNNATGLFVVLYIVNFVFVVIYVLFQIILSVFVLHDWWALGAILLGCFFFISGQILMYVFSFTICIQVKHYLDGVFFGTACNLFAIMMVYKYWDMITSEDLEFSVSNSQNGWDIKELMDESVDDGYSQYAPSSFAFNQGNHHMD